MRNELCMHVLNILLCLNMDYFSPLILGHANGCFSINEICEVHWYLTQRIHHNSHEASIPTNTFKLIHPVITIISMHALIDAFMKPTSQKWLLIIDASVNMVIWHNILSAREILHHVLCFISPSLIYSMGLAQHLSLVLFGRQKVSDFFHSLNSTVVDKCAQQHYE